MGVSQRGDLCPRTTIFMENNDYIYIHQPLELSKSENLMYTPKNLAASSKNNPSRRAWVCVKTQNWIEMCLNYSDTFPSLGVSGGSPTNSINDLLNHSRRDDR